MKRSSILIVACIAVSLIQCTKHESKKIQQRDHEIPQELRTLINEKDQQLLAAITQQDAAALESMFSEHMKERIGNNLESMIDQASDMIKTNEYEVIHQYYVVNSTDTPEIQSDIDGEKFIFKPKLKGEVNFISLLSITIDAQHFMLTNLYSKYGESWKLDLTQIGPLTVGNDLATSMYQKAQEQFKQEHYVDAANTMYICSQLLKPSGDLFSYEKEAEIMEFYKTSYLEVRKQHEFPDTLLGLKTMPIIASIIPQITANGIIPEVKYLTSAELSDSAMIRIEREQIHQTIIHRYKGFAENNDSVIFMTFPIDPDKLIEPITVTKSNALASQMGM